MPPGLVARDRARTRSAQREVTRQAATIAYLNDFQFMMWVTLAAVPLLVFLRRPARPAGGPVPAPVVAD